MSSPLRNTIRSFWTPEKSDDPEFLRLVRQDKAVVLVGAASLLAALAGIVAAVVGIVNIYT